MFSLVVFATASARKDPAANKSALILIAKTWALSCICTFETFSQLASSTDSFWCVNNFDAPCICSRKNSEEFKSLDAFDAGKSESNPMPVARGVHSSALVAM
ncbi:hypothetical protein Y032_0005g2549 [Ancylostoma ceylanicum]|uniref:Uncharacterized protein n=1 Tax=Ancylostoma ceylanicum TaxID=53326 RepID=A0A016VT92_9BILA|nr:hypothetical protein Y032_0005g2549 [Ancylostoma ceylanicum]